jgi:hypothetical protein
MESIKAVVKGKNKQIYDNKHAKTPQLSTKIYKFVFKNAFLIPQKNILWLHCGKKTIKSKIK